MHIHDPELLPTALTFTRSHKAKLVYDAHENLVAQIESKAYLSRAAKPLARLAASTLTAAADRLADAIVIAEPELAPLFPKNPTVVAVQNYPWVSNLMGEPASTQVGDRPTIGYVGAISSDRGLEAMVEATQRSRHKPRLLLAGKLHPESLRDKLKTESVSYVGPISPAAVPDFIAQFDVGLCLLLPKPNYVDAKSTKIYEYMAAARPFVYSNFPRWVREHGSEYGTPVSPDDIESIVDAIDQLLDDGAGRERMGTRGRQRVRDDFSYEAQADALTRLYDSLLEGRPQQRLQGQNY
ncbi:Alpha-D-kanosaminyltransferase [Barrientosiimonas humi]|nr:Alpha-D-kanosaminyltransferase [Barrientosiimonas humi]